MYIKDSIIMNYVKRFYDSSFFMALLVASLVLMLYLAMLRATALSVQPSYGLGKTTQGQTLQVKPVAVQHFSDLSEPNDIQPALGYRVLQDTAPVSLQ